MILGTVISNIDEAKCTAMNQGLTEWADCHPLTDSADIFHVFIHHFEGSHVGEGNHTGYNNAKYWLVCGPKKLGSPAVHAVILEMTRKATIIAPYCVQATGLVASSLPSLENGKSKEVKHITITGGDKNRIALVFDGEWDGFAFVYACKKAEHSKLSKEECDELKEFPRLGLRLF
eukprot:13064590-Ditylum_brightwellii.AAC.2